MLNQNHSRLILGSLVMAMACGIWLVITDTPIEVIAAESTPLENLLSEEVEFSDVLLTIRPEVSKEGQVRLWIGYHSRAATDDGKQPSSPIRSKTTNVVLNKEATLVLGLTFDDKSEVSMRVALYEEQDDGA